MTKPDPTRLVDVVAPKVLDALKLASEALTRATPERAAYLLCMA